MQIHTIPFFKDNYAYLIIDKKTEEAAIVDPAEPSNIIPVLKKLKSTTNFKLSKILTTHKHWDHAGGNVEMKKEFPQLEVYGSKVDEIPELTNPVDEGDVFYIGEIKVEILFTPCHTKGHVLYLASCNGQKALFTGDTLFSGGCGRFFEGDAKQMQSAMDKISKLDNETELYFGHEYTASNLKFALSVEPNNEELKKKMENVLKLREEGKFTTPSTVGDEKTFNPFLRTNVQQLMENLNQKDAVSTMHVLREMKNKF
eukprot:gene10641-3264_t